MILFFSHLYLHYYDLAIMTQNMEKYYRDYSHFTLVIQTSFFLVLYLDLVLYGLVYGRTVVSE